MKRVILIQPRVGFEGASYWEPLGLGYIAAYLKQQMPEITVEVYSGAFDSDETIIKACKDADIVGFGCTSPQMKHALNLGNRITHLNPGVYTVFGGYHPSALPFETVQHEAVDKVIVGEGEHGMLATVKGNRMNVLFSEQLDFDSLPNPDRVAIKNERYIAVAEKETGERITSVQASRGCPFRCLPCSNIIIHGKRIRMREPQAVIREMLLIRQKYNLDFIKFCDATFNVSVKRVITFCKQMKKLSKVKGKWWGCNIHPRLVSREMFKWMVKAGCREVWIGVESGSPKILKEMRKGVTVQGIKKAFKLSKEEGLVRRAYFIVGSPSEDQDDLELTEKLAKEIDAEVYGFTILCPFPATELFDPVKYKDVDWASADEYGNKFWRNMHYTNEELWKIRSSFVEKFKDKMCWRLQEHEN